MRYSQIWLVSLLSVAALGSAYLPVKAQPAQTQTGPCVNDAANIQEQGTNIVLTGNRNAADVGNSQTNVNQGSRPCGSTGNVQRQRTNIDAQGNDNDVRVNNRQTNVDQSDTGNSSGRRQVNFGN
ncbi:hypothetical protein ACE1CD_29225 [Aerosakkonema sp. BLCC-F183]|uniref:hypothetical protein n=1 Tax=Aerosakkonema sp. BLCC-F183 TaxID=3342834 RepID=UPI0035BAC948